MTRQAPVTTQREAGVRRWQRDAGDAGGAGAVVQRRARGPLARALTGQAPDSCPASGVAMAQSPNRLWAGREAGPPGSCAGSWAPAGAGAVPASRVAGGHRHCRQQPPVRDLVCQGAVPPPLPQRRAELTPVEKTSPPSVPSSPMVQMPGVVDPGPYAWPPPARSPAQVLVVLALSSFAERGPRSPGVPGEA